MQREPRAWVGDMVSACQAILQFTRGKSLADYQAEAMLRSAVERQFEILGEALSRLTAVAPQLAARVHDARKIVAFRNVLAHGYATVDDATVWEAVEERVPGLLSVLEQLGGELDDAGVR